MSDDVKAIIAGAFAVLTLVIVAVDYKGFSGIISAGSSAFNSGTSALLSKTAS